MQVPVGDAAGAGFEALSVLRAAALRTAGPLADQLAARALRVTERGDFAVAQDALQAMLRRLAAARDAGAVLSRPRRRGRGWYSVRRGDPAGPHHDVLLSSLDPIEGSCSCPDYRKASLGVCEHIFLVAATQVHESGATGPPLRWDPVRPMTGSGDWLERLAWWDRPALLTALQQRTRRLFRARDGEKSTLAPAVIASPAARLAAVESLLDMVRADAPLAEPAVRPLLEYERELLTWRVRHAPTAREIHRHCDALRQRLFLYQREGVRRFLERGRLLLADDMGLGKTAQAIAACHVLMQSGRARRGVVVVPASLAAEWAAEWQRFTDVPLAVVQGSAAERARTVRRAGGGVLLVNDEQLIADLAQLVRFRPDVVVLDEVQRFANRDTRTASCVKKLDARWRLVLTGTPVENRIHELASIMEWVDETALEPRWRLSTWHCATGDASRAATAPRNLDTLRQRLAPSMMRRVRREVVEQLPARRDTHVSVPVTAAQLAVHDRLVLPIAQMVSQAARRPLGQPEFLRLMSLLVQQRILCNGLAHAHFVEVWPTIARRRPTAALLDSLASPKLAELRERLSAIAIGQERKVVVFSQWTRMLHLAVWASSDLLRAAAVRGVVFTGDEGARRRTEQLVAFHDDPAVRVLFATDAGGVGLNLQRAASCCIHLDLPWNPAVLEQRTGRIHRVGQDEPVDTYALVADDGIEGRIAAMLGDQKALVTELFDGTSDTVAFEQASSFLARVASLLGGACPADAAGGDERDLVDAPPLAEDGQAAPDDGAVDVTEMSGASAASLFSQIQVTRRPDGRVAFEAPAPAASALAELFQAVARLLAPASEAADEAGEPM